MLQGRYLGSQKLQTSDRCCQMQGKIPFNVNKTRSQRSVTACSLRGRIYSQRSQPHHMLDRSSGCQAMLCALSESSSIPQDQCCVSCRQLQHPSGPGSVLLLCRPRASVCGTCTTWTRLTNTCCFPCPCQPPLTCPAFPGP